MVLIGYTGWCIFTPRPEEPPAVVTQQPAVAPAAAPDVLTSKTVLRDESTGESLRIEKRDGQGVMRELEIHFADKTIGRRYYDPTGLNVVKVSRSTPGGGTMEGVPGADGRFSQWTQTNEKGVVVRHMKWLGKTGYQLRVFRQDGTLFWEKIVTFEKGKVFRQYQDDGKTLLFETEAGNLRTRTEVYDAAGKLLYREKLADPAKARFGDVVEFVGEILDSSGKVVRRTICNEGPYSGWDDSFTDVDELADDGTVKSSFHPDREDNTDYRSPYKDKQLKHIHGVKDKAYRIQNEGGLNAEVDEQKLDEVLSK